MGIQVRECTFPLYLNRLFGYCLFVFVKIFEINKLINTVVCQTCIQLTKYVVLKISS